MAFPGTYDINYYKGDTFEFKIYPKDNNGGPFNLAGYDEDSKFTISTSRGSEATTIGYSKIFQDYILCTITPSNGEDLNAGTTYVYDVEIRKPDTNYNYVYTLLTGSIRVTEQVTPPSLFAPQAAQEFDVTEITDTTVTITWSAPANVDYPPTGYIVGLVTPPSTVAVPVATLPSNATTYTYTSLNPETLYGVGVAAFNDAGAGPEAGEFVTTLEATP
jgi:hypothetical protein